MIFSLGDHKKQSVQRGSSLYFEFTLSKLEGIDDRTDYWFYYACGIAFQSYVIISMGFLLPQVKEATSKILGVQGARVMRWVDEYSFELFHVRGVATLCTWFTGADCLIVGAWRGSLWR